MSPEITRGVQDDGEGGLVSVLQLGRGVVRWVRKDSSQKGD